MTVAAGAALALVTTLGLPVQAEGLGGADGGMKISNRQWSADAWQRQGAASTLTTYAVCLRTNRISEEDQTENELAAGPMSLTQEGACPGGTWSAGV